jgi:tetratricopeptide (TPR) repeat protein
MAGEAYADKFNDFNTDGIFGNHNRAKKFPESIAAAQEALKLRPDYAEAYNNIAAAYEEMHMWDRAIEEAQKALKIKPDFQLARNNLAWSLQQKQKESGK